MHGACDNGLEKGFAILSKSLLKFAPMSDIMEKTEAIRASVRAHGNYRSLEGDGLTYHWIQKFACGSIKNPTVENVAKLEQALKKIAAPAQP
jgi:hypothetical protein